MKKETAKEISMFLTVFVIIFFITGYFWPLYKPIGFSIVTGEPEVFSFNWGNLIIRIAAALGGAFGSVHGYEDYKEGRHPLQKIGNWIKKKRSKSN